MSDDIKVLRELLADEKAGRRDASSIRALGSAIKALTGIRAAVALAQSRAPTVVGYGHDAHNNIVPITIEAAQPPCGADGAGPEEICPACLPIVGRRLAMRCAATRRLPLPKLATTMPIACAQCGSEHLNDTKEAWAILQLGQCIECQKKDNDHQPAAPVAPATMAVPTACANCGKPLTFTSPGNGSCQPMCSRPTFVITPHPAAPKESQGAVADEVREIFGCHPRDDLSHAPLVKASKPVGSMLEASFQQYDGTNVCQWHARVGESPLWKPRGPMFRLAASQREGGGT